MAIFRTIKNKDYTTIHNGFLLDKNLSLKAKGLLGYCLSKPNSWNFFSSEIVKNCRDGKDAVYTGIKELEANGYIKRTPKRNEKGKFTGGFDYLVYENPLLGKAMEDKEIKDIEVNVKEINEDDIKGNPILEKSKEGNPIREKQIREKPIWENQALVNTEYILNTEAKENTKYKVSTKTITNTNNKDCIYDNCSNSSCGNSNSLDNSDIYKFYFENGLGKLTKGVMSVLDEFIDKYSKEQVKAAFIAAIKRDIYNLGYIQGILENWRQAKSNGEHGTSSSKEYREEVKDCGSIFDIDDL